MLVFGVPILLAVFAFALVIIVHELGHYLIGYWCGIRARVFSVGLGPTLFSVIDKRGTEWKISLLPLGGYVKFFSLKDKENTFLRNIDQPDGILNFGNECFERATILKRSFTVLAGPLANILMAITIFSLVSILSGVTSNEPVVGKVMTRPNDGYNLMTGDRVLRINGQEVKFFDDIFSIAYRTNPESKSLFEILRDGKLLELSIPYIFQPIVANVELFSPAMRAGIMTGDVFLEVNSKTIFSFEELRKSVLSSDGEPLSIKYWREGSKYKTYITPELRPTQTITGDIREIMRIGIRGGAAIYPAVKDPSLLEALSQGSSMTFYVLKTSLVGIYRIIDNTISPKHLSGPVGVAQALTHSAIGGLIPFLSLLAAISAGIGLINLFPIPVLDGGHLVFFLYEAIFKSPPNEKVTNSLIVAGVTILIVMMVFVTINDIVRL